LKRRHFFGSYNGLRRVLQRSRSVFGPAKAAFSSRPNLSQRRIGPQRRPDMMAAGWWRMHTFRGTWTTGHNAAGKRWCRQTQEAQFGDPVAENHGLGHDGFCWGRAGVSSSLHFCTNAAEFAQFSLPP
jgi:hypothetical protein